MLRLEPGDVLSFIDPSEIILLIIASHDVSDQRCATVLVLDTRPNGGWEIGEVGPLMRSVLLNGSWEKLG